MAISKELKKIVLELTQDQKDKLLLKLIGRNKILIEQLEFELLEEKSTLESRRAEIKFEIGDFGNEIFYSPGLMMNRMKYINNLITHHVKITKDKYGEVELTLMLMNQLFESHLKWVEKYSGNRDKLAVYIARRAKFLNQKLSKIHEDLQADFLGSWEILLENTSKYTPAIHIKY